MTRSERIHKVLANAGVGSRRQIERWIEAGRIAVNGKPAQRGQPLAPGDRVELDGQPVRFASVKTQRLIAYNKPVGQICTRSDPEGRETIFENLPKLHQGRWVSVGRLDINTSGLLLLTTDGQLAAALMHPSNRVIREYRVRVLGALKPETLATLQNGVELDDGAAKFDSIAPAGGSGINRWYVCCLREGRNREVRRLFEAVGVQVNRLIRTRFGPVRLPRDLRPGQWRNVAAGQLEKLQRTVGVG